MTMKFHLPFPTLICALLLVAGPSAADDEKKGHGAGGVRADHASEQGLEKGEAWAGSKDKKDKSAKDKEEKHEKKQKKEKKEKKSEG
jgi:hypothetical protein